MSSQHSPTRHRAIEILCGLFVILILSFVYLVDSARDDARRSTCKGQLAQIGFALRSYYGEYGRMPPAYIADAQERPMHSWRVLMLPYIGGDEFYERYDFTEPWNGPNNSALAESAEARASAH